MTQAASRALAWIGIAASCALASAPVSAATAATRFEVKVTLASGVGPAPQGDFCRLSNAPGAFGAILTVVCRTGVVVQVESPAGAPGWSAIQGGGQRYHLSSFAQAGVMSGTSDLHTGLGTVTSWRLVNLADRDYLEMTVRW
jgi:hypothetical protein